MAGLKAPSIKPGNIYEGGMRVSRRAEITYPDGSSLLIRASFTDDRRCYLDVYREEPPNEHLSDGISVSVSATRNLAASRYLLKWREKDGTLQSMEIVEKLDLEGEIDRLAERGIGDILVYPCAQPYTPAPRFTNKDGKVYRRGT